ncbi:MAG: altronate dehydratase family protein [Saprospiraceae bacterium]|nr:altronate dehydratase family protein [Saprospiraceae bacterium]MCF8250513.1 altronate dehydratase family protein [Saprospiraceae bacterium]MCF8279653.1 altronate dehydratase family protein [Bacteroidales bacterium]MCF8312439.1 altronate dehydratase family protein [Saprospiraceae bacterium]MCF8440744.1 altronate dehydratase family protein [Saprospiraceae bacterium]
MKSNILKVHPNDNIIAALQDLRAGEQVASNGYSIELLEDIPTKHKFAEHDFVEGDEIIMYGVRIGRAMRLILKGTRISRENVVHDSENYSVGKRLTDWHQPNISKLKNRTFKGFQRPDGKVGTRNYWLVIPLVFCENRNIEVVRDAMLEPLGYLTGRHFSVNVAKLVQLHSSGVGEDELLSADIIRDASEVQRRRPFPNVDGIKFLTHDGGCGGTRQDSEALCRLLAGYILNSNVAGATVLSLGCQHAQIELLRSALDAFDPQHGKPVFFLEQQKSKSERDFIADAVKQTFVGLAQANRMERRPAPLSKLVVGLECGGSDGFSGISANPALGYASDLLATLGGTMILSEFPELNAVEQNLIDRCTTDEIAEKFAQLMRSYSQRAKEVGSGFEMNPSPGNIRDGLITDAMKSAGAAKKGGTSPVTDVLDYTEQVTRPGLTLLCTPGNDVESTTAEVGSGANIVVFTTGLGTPTGNPIAPVIKMATNTALARRMPDIIDIDAGTIISGEDSIETKGEELLELMIKVASGEAQTHAERLGQDDFIPWKRGVSL